VSAKDDGVVDNVRRGNPAAFRLIDLHSDVLARLQIS
jgi:hypothetical protein